MPSTAWLISHDFQPAGEWIDASSLVHRTAWLRRQAGVYAFVVGDEVRYIGRAGTLHRRLRNYSLRCFGQGRKREPRRVHHGIMGEIARGNVVRVYVKLVPPDSTQTIGQIEASLISEAQPAWNVSLIGDRHVAE